MFISKLKENFKENEPIFTEEILDLYQEVSRAQLFRYINLAKEKGEIIQYDKGIYLIPKKSRLGISTISADDVVEKRYLCNKQKICGVYSGLKLLNDFAITTQMPAVIEIVTNNESSKCREIQIKNRRFILRRSRFKIDRSNVAVYTVLQLFSEFNNKDRLNENAKRRLLEYIRITGVTREQICNYVMRFPPKTAQNLIGSGILNEIT